jgi:acetoin utilization deacetylase AcuC-like enzyme
VSELIVIDQRGDVGQEAPWVLEDGKTMRGHESTRRIAQLRSGLMHNQRVRAVAAEASDDELEETLSALHEPAHLAALRELRSDEPVVLPDLAPPGLAPDMAVCAGLVAAAHEGVRTAIDAAQQVLAGERFTYALCRPPGHHAGPCWVAGYCYLNNAAAAVHTLLRGGIKPVGVLDLDIHYPNGTSAIVAPITDASLHSLHAWPVTNVAAHTVTPPTPREHVVEFCGSPSAASYLEAVAISVDQLVQSSEVLVLSLGYDTVAGDPHGSWNFSPSIFERIGRLLAASQLPVCVIQEGGYALDTLAACSGAFADGLLGGDASPLRRRVRLRRRLAPVRRREHTRRSLDAPYGDAA